MAENPFKEWLENLKASNLPIIVEGPNDRKALELIGLTNIHELKGPLFQIAESLEKTETVVILTDFDDKGKELYGKLCKEFSRVGVKIDKYYREFLQNNSRISHIEGIASLFNK